MGTTTAGSDTSADSASLKNRVEEKIRQQNYTLPMLPQVASQVLSMSNDPNADLGDLSDLIHKDQALAGNVLRIANSAAFGTTDKIVSLSQAVARLGMSLMGEIALAASLKNGVFEAPGFQDEIKNLWQHSLASGACGKEIARAKRHNVEGQFLCSLLHCIGKPVVLKIASDCVQELKMDAPHDAVSSIIDEFHITLGKSIAEKWGLPQQVQTSIEYYLNYAEAPSFDKEVSMTYLSHQMANWILDEKATPVEELKENPIFMELNFYPDEVEELLEKRESIVTVIESMAL